MFITAEIESLAFTAQCAPYGSDLQTEAQNELCDIVEGNVAPHVWAEFEAWCLKATVDEVVSRALELLEQVE